jgi:hypothetical protein
MGKNEGAIGRLGAIPDSLVLDAGSHSGYTGLDELSVWNT